jgi:hypothetical protein
VIAFLPLSFSRAGHERFRESDALRRVFEGVVAMCIAATLDAPIRLKCNVFATGGRPVTIWAKCATEQSWPSFERANYGPCASHGGTERSIITANSRQRGRPTNG